MYTDWEPSPRSSRQSNRRFKKVRGSSALRAEQVRTNEGARRGLYLRGLVLYPPLLLRRLALNSLYVHRFGQESCGSRQPPSSSLSLILSPKKREVGGENEAGAATGSFRLVLLLLFHANLIPSLLTSVRNTIYKISDRKPERPHALEFLILVRPLSSPPCAASTSECGPSYGAQLTDTQVQAHLKETLALLLRVAADPWRLFPPVPALPSWQTFGNS